MKYTKQLQPIDTILLEAEVSEIFRDAARLSFIEQSKLPVCWLPMLKLWGVGGYCSPLLREAADDAMRHYKIKHERTIPLP